MSKNRQEYRKNNLERSRKYQAKRRRRLGIVSHLRDYNSIYDDFTGKNFGFLNVINIAGYYCDKNLKPLFPIYYCKCQCGNYINKIRGGVKRGFSCGCYQKVIMKKVCTGKFITHGYSNSTEFKSWIGCKTRCYNKNNPNYNNYGGRNITVCNRWLESFQNFIDDMGEKPKDGKRYSLDRINNDGNYEPSNCRWATDSEQNKNRRKFKRTIK